MSIICTPNCKKSLVKCKNPTSLLLHKHSHQARHLKPANEQVTFAQKGYDYILKPATCSPLHIIKKNQTTIRFVL